MRSGCPFAAKSKMKILGCTAVLTLKPFLRNSCPARFTSSFILKFGLTYRQRQLVTLVGRGLTTKEIAANLHLSQFTVKNHIHRIMKQMDVQSRYETVDLIRASGYLPDS